MCNLSAAPQVARCVRAQKTLAEASIRPITRRTSPIDTYRVLVVFTAVNQTTLPRGQLKEDRLETDTGPTLQRTGTIFNRLRTANTAPTVRRVKFIIFKTGRKRNKIHDFYLVLALTRADGYDPPNFQPNGTKLIRSDVLPVQMTRRRCVHCIYRAYTFRLDVDGFAKKNPLCTQTQCTPPQTDGRTRRVLHLAAVPKIPPKQDNTVRNVIRYRRREFRFRTLTTVFFFLRAE